MLVEFVVQLFRILLIVLLLSALGASVFMAVMGGVFMMLMQVTQ